MALNANAFTTSVLDPGPDQVEWTEGLGSVTVRIGHYKNLSRPDEEIMIDREKTVTNQYGHAIRKDIEYWHYDVPGAPPLRYERTTYAYLFLPGLGRAFRKVEEETQYFWAFSALTDEDNLGRTRIVNAYVVYDLPEDPTAAASAEGKEKTQDKGMRPGTTRDRIVSSGKLWSEANLDGAIVEDATVAQTTVWIDGVIVEQDLVEEEFDKWTKWKIKKNALRPGGVEWEGPEYTRKESYTYKLPVPLQPPKLSGKNSANGIVIDLEGGGAKIMNGYFGPRGTYHVAPEQYYIYRKVAVEPTRQPDDDLEGWWETPPAAGARRVILENTAVTDYAGNPASPLPLTTSYDEPHDPDPEPEPRDTAFSRIAEVDNINGKDDEGAATFLDTDVEETGQYEYYATAVYGTQESSDSNHETVTFGGGGTRKHRIISKPYVVDVIAADDPGFPDEDFGEIVDFDLPIDPEDDEEGIVDDIADRQFAMNREADFSITLTVLHPILGLEWGQKVKLPVIEWDTYGNMLHMVTQTEDDVWMLIGFQRSIMRNKDGGGWSSPETILTLQERPRPQ